jgi:hypothetical protein
MVRFWEHRDTADWVFAPITCSTLDVGTGELKWYFQFTPPYHYGYDATETPISYLC